MIAPGLARYRAAQGARYERLNNWVLARLRYLDAMGKEARASDQAFIIHRILCAGRRRSTPPSIRN